MREERRGRKEDEEEEESNVGRVVCRVYSSYLGSREVVHVGAGHLHSSTTTTCIWTDDGELMPLEYCGGRRWMEAIGVPVSISSTCM